MERRRTTVGGAVDECIRNTTEAWFREHAGFRSREEAFGEDVKELTTSTSSVAGGQLRVTVGIVARKRSQQRLDHYVFQRQGKLGYVQTERSKAKR